MKTIDVYKQYFSADCIYNQIERNGALVTLTSTSDSGTIKYEVTVTFFPHKTAEDFSISYDAYLAKEIYYAKGRRSKKREGIFLTQIRQYGDEIAEQFHATINWENPLTGAFLE